MARVNIYILPVIFLLFTVQPLFAQSKKDLEAQKEKMKKDIAYTNELIQQTRKNKKHSLYQLSLIKRKIDSRKELINSIKSEISRLGEKIDDDNMVIESLENDLRQIKSEYARLIYFAYKNKNSYDRLIFILSSNDFNQAYKRLKYLQQYTDYRKKQTEVIESLQETLKQNIARLEKIRNEKK